MMLMLKLDFSLSVKRPIIRFVVNGIWTVQDMSNRYWEMTKIPVATNAISQQN